MTAVLRTVLGAIGFAAVSIGLNLVASELFGYGTRVGLWFVRLWSRLLPPDQRDRYREEWEADVIRISQGANPGISSGNHHLTAMTWGFLTLRPALALSNARHRLVHSDRFETAVQTTGSALMTVMVVILVSELVAELMSDLAAGMLAVMMIPLLAVLTSGRSGGWLAGRTFVLLAMMLVVLLAGRVVDPATAVMLVLLAVAEALLVASLVLVLKVAFLDRWCKRFVAWARLS